MSLEEKKRFLEKRIKEVEEGARKRLIPPYVAYPEIHRLKVRLEEVERQIAEAKSKEEKQKGS